MKSITFVAFLGAALTSAGFAQDPAETSPEKAAVIANDRLYEAAYANADVEALVNFFTEDAGYTTEEGRTFSGRAEIEAAIRAGLMANRGSKLAINAETVRVLGPESVLEKGSTTVTAKDGETSGSLYTAIHVKKDGKWKIDQLIESPLPALTARDRLAELAWLVGDWEETDKTDDLSIRSVYSWARGGNFLTRSVTVKRAGNVTLEGWQIIGWDPIDERIRSWTFDSEGGFADGYFTREGSRWLLRETGVAPDGSRYWRRQYNYQDHCGSLHVGIEQPYARRRSAAQHRTHRDKSRKRKLMPCAHVFYPSWRWRPCSPCSLKVQRYTRGAAVGAEEGWWWWCFARGRRRKHVAALGRRLATLRRWRLATLGRQWSVTTFGRRKRIASIRRRRQCLAALTTSVQRCLATERWARAIDSIKASLGRRTAIRRRERLAASIKQSPRQSEWTFQASSEPT